MVVYEDRSSVLVRRGATSLLLPATLRYALSPLSVKEKGTSEASVPTEPSSVVHGV